MEEAASVSGSSEGGEDMEAIEMEEEEEEEEEKEKAETRGQVSKVGIGSGTLMNAKIHVLTILTGVSSWPGTKGRGRGASSRQISLSHVPCGEK